MSAIDRNAAQAVLTIDLDALKRNWRRLADRVAPAECGAVVKADAYGLGIDRVVPALAWPEQPRTDVSTPSPLGGEGGSRQRRETDEGSARPLRDQRDPSSGPAGHLLPQGEKGGAGEGVGPSNQQRGCRTFFVAHLSEGVRARTALREAGFADSEAVIYLLHGLQPGALIHPALAAYSLWPVLGSLPELDAWAAAGPCPCAIQIDTGMNRIGIDYRRLAELPTGLIAATGARLVISHFVAAEEPDNPSNDAQIARFEAACTRFFPGLPRSLENSSGHMLPQQPAYELTRPGYALYGGNLTPDQPNPMRPVIRLDAAILQTREIEPGETVGYNGRWTARRPTRLATIGVGYADGIPRGAPTLGSGQGPIAFMGGVPCPWVGRISMDLSVVDITDAPDDAVVPGAPVELIGPNMPLDEFGTRCGTIGYEILTGLGARYHRVYVENT